MDHSERTRSTQNDIGREPPTVEGYAVTSIENGISLTKDGVRGINKLLLIAGMGICVVLMGMSAVVVYQAGQAGLNLSNVIVAMVFSLPGLFGVIGIRGSYRILARWRVTMVVNGDLQCDLSVGVFRRKLVFHYPLRLILRRSFNRGDWGFTVFLQDVNMRRVLLVIPTMVASNERRAWRIGHRLAQWIASQIRADVVLERWSRAARE